MTYIPNLPIFSVAVPENRARDFDPAWAEALAHIISAQGLLQPIRVRETPDGGYVLIAGLYRLRACQLLGLATIPAILSDLTSDDAARLEEVMENLGRAELIALDRCHHLWELKAVWLALHPKAAAGGDRKSIKAQTLRFDSGGEIFGFGKAVAEKIGLSVRSIETGVKVWASLSPASRRRLVGTELAHKMTELKALSDESPERQAKILDLILGDAPVENVAQALDFLNLGSAPTAEEKRFLTASRLIGGLDDQTLDSVLAAHEARVIDSLKRRGRI